MLDLVRVDVEDGDVLALDAHHHSHRPDTSRRREIPEALQRDRRLDDSALRRHVERRQVLQLVAARRRRICALRAYSIKHVKVAHTRLPSVGFRN